MKVVCNDESFVIKFYYQSGKIFGKKSLINVHKRQIITKCDICVTDENGGYYTIASGKSIKCKIDKFDKGLGRRRALTDALSSIKCPEIREKVWDSYFVQHKDGKAIKALEVLE